MAKIFIIGHSNRKWTDFISTLKNNHVDVVVDVRRYPGSRACPQFNKEHMTIELKKENISYIHVEKLGGRRKRSDTIRSRYNGDNNNGWKNEGFRVYADYMATTSFREGIREILLLMTKQGAFIQNVSSKNAVKIAEYILAMKTETNLSDAYRKLTIESLSLLSRFNKNKSFADMTKEEVLFYLDDLRKSETADPLHKWIGTYNLKRMILLRFFKWLYNPSEDPKKRKSPTVMENIPILKRREQSIYKPADLWTIDDDLLFLKYCPNNRDRCYHAISRDTSCRPNEILRLRIKDVAFKTASDNYQYAEALVNGKTGSRSTPLFNSIPYVKDWLDEHIQRGNPNASLIPSRDRKNFGRRLSGTSMNLIYRRYKSKYFPRLIEDPNIPTEDKNKIRELLKKPWNPYIRRHSALTEKSTILKEHTLRQHAGWSGRSQMHLKYIHYFGNESSEGILEAYGILPKDKQLSEALRPTRCPNCSEPNKPDSRFCAKCRMVLTYGAYNETLEKQREKEDKLTLIEERFNSMQSQMQTLLTAIVNMKDQNKVNEFSKTLFDSGILRKHEE